MRPARKTLLDFALVLGGKFSSLAVVFLGGILIARTAGSAEYGVFMVAVTLVLLGDGLIGAPFDLAAVRFFALHPGEEERSRRFEAFTLQLKLLIAVVAFTLALGCRSLLARKWPAIEAPGFPMLSCCVALLALLAARSTAASLQNRQRFRLYSAADFVQGLVRSAGFLVLAAVGWASATSYLLVYGLAAFGVAVFGWVSLRQTYLLGRWPSREDSARMLGYCGYAAGIVTLATLTGRGDLLLLALVKGAGSSAPYGLASQLTLLVTQVAMYASVLTQPRVLAFHRQGRIRRLFGLNAVAVVGLTLVSWVAWSPDLMARGLISGFGPGFDAAAPLLRILWIGVLLDWLIVPVVVVFCVQECPARAFLGELATALLFLAAGAAVMLRPWPWSAEVMVAWIAVLGRVAKMIFYGGLFFAHSGRRRGDPGAVAGPMG